MIRTWFNQISDSNLNLLRSSNSIWRHLCRISQLVYKISMIFQEIQTATQHFRGHTIGLVWLLSDVGVTCKSIMAANYRKYVVAHVCSAFIRDLLSFIAYYIPTLDVVQYSHKSCCVARPRNCCGTRWNFVTSMCVVGAAHEIVYTFPVIGGHVWFWCTSYLDVKEYSHLSNRVTVPQKCGGSRLNLVIISYTSWDIGHCIKYIRFMAAIFD